MILKLKKIQEEHLEMVRNWRNSPDVSMFMYTNDYITEEDQKKWYGKIKNDPSKKYWVVDLENSYVGVVNIVDIDLRNRRCFWAYYLADSSVRGKGLGKIIELNIIKYVFEVLNLNKLCCEVFAFNEKVVKIHEKFGSKIEGTFRQHIYKDNQFHDIICMAILRDDWNQIKETFEFEKIEID